MLREPRKQTVMRPRTKSSLRLARTWGYSSITAVITASRPPNCPGNTGVRWGNGTQQICSPCHRRCVVEVCHTVLSSPSVIIIRKKMTAKKVEPIMLAMASG